MIFGHVIGAVKAANLAFGIGFHCVHDSFIRPSPGIPILRGRYLRRWAELSSMEASLKCNKFVPQITPVYRFSYRLSSRTCALKRMFRAANTGKCRANAEIMKAPQRKRPSKRLQEQPAVTPGINKLIPNRIHETAS